MAELVQTATSNTPGDAAVAARRWPRNQSFLLAGLASLLCLSLIVAPTWYGMVACLVVTLVYASRTWPRAVRFFVFAVIPNNVIWIGFVALRGYGNESPLTATTRLYARRLEVWLFGGELPTTVLQRHFFDADDLRWLVYVFTAVHASFFLVPSAVVLSLWWVDPARYRRTLTALVMTLAMGLICFVLFPTNPPWMNPGVDDPNPVPVERVNYYVATSMGVTTFGDDQNLDAETNPLAAMPSIHFGVTFLLLIALWGTRKRWVAFAAVNVLLMGVALVYLGEHLVIDEIAGAAIALLAWRYALRVLAWGKTRVGQLLSDSLSARLRMLRERGRWARFPFGLTR